MRQIFFLLFFTFCITVLGQSEKTIYSVYFGSGDIEEKTQLSGFSSSHYGAYILSENDNNLLRSAAGDQLLIDETGLYLEKNKLLSISRTEIRENPKFNIRNGYLFGVIERDSLPVALEGENYYFLVPKKTYLFEVRKDDFHLYQGLNKQDYLILTRETVQRYSALYVSVNSGMVSLKEIDLDQTFFDLREVMDHQSIAQKNEMVYTIFPTNAEWDKIMNCFQVYDTYTVLEN